MKILLVEDSAPMRRLIRQIIGDLAVEVHECNGGAEAVAAYRQYQPGWVLVDLELKESDGLTVTAQIKAADPNAKVILLTSYDDHAMGGGGGSGGRGYRLHFERQFDGIARAGERSKTSRRFSALSSWLMFPLTAQKLDCRTGLV